MKLEIELIPQTTFFKNVRSLVGKEEWDRIRKLCYQKAKYRCEICGEKGEKWPVECHEVWDYNFETRVQKLIRLIALCPSCHEVKHIGLALINGRLEEATKHFMKVNCLSYDEAAFLIDEAWNEWRRKNDFQWKLDVTLLNLERR